jgi:hypothetical protein
MFGSSLRALLILLLAALTTSRSSACRSTFPGQDRPTCWIEGWHRVYDLKTSEFSVPPDFADNNTRAVKTPESKPE